MCERLNATFGGPVQRTGGTWKLLTSTASEEVRCEGPWEVQGGAKSTPPPASRRSDRTILARRFINRRALPPFRRRFCFLPEETSLFFAPYKRNPLFRAFIIHSMKRRIAVRYGCTIVVGGAVQLKRNTHRLTLFDTEIVFHQ